MKRIGRAFITALLVSSMTVSTVLATPSVDELKEEKAEAQSEVNSLQEELSQIIEKINQLEADLITKGEEIAQAEADLVAAEEKEQKQYEDMKLRIKFMYEAGDADAIETICASENFAELLNRAEYVQSVHSYDRQMLNEYVETKEEIAKLKSSLETEMANLQIMQEEFETEKESLNQTIEEKKTEVANIEEEIQAAIEAAEEENNYGGGTTNNYTGTGDTSVGSAIVSAAASYLGVPYVWGGTSGSGVDCSGLVYLAHKKVGISVTRYSGSLGSGGKAVSASEAMPGDVVCYSGHVGIYVGGGMMIHAPKPGQVVCYQNVNYKTHWFRRYW